MEVFGFDHIDLTVNDLERSAAFYEKVLGKLGFDRLDDKGEAIFSNGHTAIGLRSSPEALRGSEFDRYRVGLHHLALRAKERADVDRFHEFLVDEGIWVLDSPAEYPQYGPAYYAVFFADPDDMKLELVHFPTGYWKRVMIDGEDPRPRYARK